METRSREMKIKIKNISEVVTIPAPRDLTAAEHAALVAEHKKERTLQALEADYRDFEAQVAAGVPADELLKELETDSISE
jgi:hypothetical protein